MSATSWTCPDCGPLGYAVLLSGRGGLRGCPLCGGLAENDDTTAEDAGDDLPPGGGVHSRRLVRVKVRRAYPLTPEQAPGKTAEQFQAELAEWRRAR